MKLRDFRIGWRLLLREPAHSLVAILGLGAGVAACLLLLAFARHSWQYNAHIPDVDTLYVVKGRFNIDPAAPWFDQVPKVVRAAAANTPGVESVAQFMPSTTTVRAGDRLHVLKDMTVLPGFARTLGLQAMEGDLERALEQPDSLAITDKAARDIFGTVHALGRTLQVDGTTLRIAAVVPAPPSNTTLPYELVKGIGSVLVPGDQREEALTGARGTWSKFIIKVTAGTSLEAIAQALQKTVDTAPGVQNIPPEIRERLGNKKVFDIKLAPLRDAYFDLEVAANPITDPGERGDPAVVAGLAGIAFMILTIASLNYVNLSTVRVLRRQREIALRKVLGADAQRIILQFTAESLLVALLAASTGLLLAAAMLPVFSELVSRKLDAMFSLPNIATATVIGLMLGLLCALYPAWNAIRVRPGQALAGRGDAESAQGRRIRWLSTVMQISTAMGLGGVALAIAWQTHFAVHADPGFDPAPLLIVDIPAAPKMIGSVNDDSVEKANAQNFVEALRRQPGVAGTTLTFDAVGRFNRQLILDMKREGGQSVSVELKPVDVHFFEQYGIRPVAGRLFDSKADKSDDSVSVVLNTVAARQLGFASPAAAIGQTLVHTAWNGSRLDYQRIVGIAPELRFHSLHEAPRATAFVLAPDAKTLTVRATKSVAEAERAVAGLWPTYFPYALRETRRAGEILAANYEDDVRLSKMLALASVIALLIASFGAYALAAHTVQRRSKEIVLRKLYGANRRQVAGLLLREAGALTLAAACVALPLAGVAIARYLAGYVEHAPVGAWTLLIALASLLLAVLSAVARHAHIAMRISPADALRM